MKSDTRNAVLEELENIEPLHREIVENYQPGDHYILPVGATADLEEIASAFDLEATEDNAKRIAAAAFSVIRRFEEELAEQTGVSQ